MSELCSQYDEGMAVIQRVGDEPQWLEQPQRVHIAAEIWADEEAASFIAAAYTVTSGCRDDLMHGDLREASR